MYTMVLTGGRGKDDGVCQIVDVDVRPQALLSFSNHETKAHALTYICQSQCPVKGPELVLVKFNAARVHNEKQTWMRGWLGFLGFKPGGSSGRGSAALHNIT